MNYSNYRFTLDIQSVQSQVSLPVKFGDTARSLYITLTDGGVPYVLKDGCRAVFSAIKGDGTHLFNNCIIENKAIIRYEFTDQTTSAEGIMQCEVIVYGSDGKVVGTPRFVMVVDNRIVYETDILSDNERDAIDNAIINEEARNNAENGYTNDSGEFINGRIQNEEIRQSNEEVRQASTERAVSYMNSVAGEMSAVATMLESNNNAWSSNENQRLSNENQRLSNENQRLSNEVARQKAETERKKGYSRMESVCDAMDVRVSTLETAASGKLYETVEQKDVAYSLQPVDVLPYGILSRVGGWSHWQGDHTQKINGEGIGSISGSILEGEPFAIVSQYAEDSDSIFKIIEYGDEFDSDGNPIKKETEIPLNTVVTHNRELRDSEACSWSGLHEVYITYGNLRLVNTPVTKISSGLPYKLEGAKVYSTLVHAAITENGAIAPKGAKYGIFFPCEIPQGAIVKARADGTNELGDTLAKYKFCAINDTTVSSVQDKETFFSAESTLTKDASHVLIVKQSATTAFKADLEIKNIRVEFADPNQGSVMTVLKSIEIPEEITSLEGYGVGLNDECYNYLDLTNKHFVRVCKVENNEVVALSATERVDVSAYLPEESDVITLASYGLLRFENEDNLPVPYSLSYKKTI